MYLPDPKSIPATWPTGPLEMRQFFQDLRTETGHRETLEAVFGMSSQSDYLTQFLLSTSGSMRMYQLGEERIHGSAWPLIDRLENEADTLHPKDFQKLRTELWQAWCAWVRPWDNTAAAVSAS